MPRRPPPTTPWPVPRATLSVPLSAGLPTVAIDLGEFSAGGVRITADVPFRLVAGDSSVEAGPDSWPVAAGFTYAARVRRGEFFSAYAEGDGTLYWEGG